MDDETYWYELEVMKEITEYDYVDELSKHSYKCSLNIFRNNRTGGRRETVEY